MARHYTLLGMAFEGDKPPKQEVMSCHEYLTGKDAFGYGAYLYQKAISEVERLRALCDSNNIDWKNKKTK